MGRLLILSVLLIMLARIVYLRMGLAENTIEDTNSSGTNYSCMKWERSGEDRIYFRCSKWFGKDTHIDAVVSSKRSIEVVDPGAYVVTVRGSRL